MPKHLSAQAAANELGITRPKLFALLRNEGLIYNSQNLPTVYAQENGLLRTEIRSHNKVAGIEKQYTALLVTAKGLTYIQELIENGKTPTRVRGGHRRTTHPLRTTRSAATSTRAFAGMGG
jgi:phage antirepressor YoqD-like protein